ncbi:MAG: transcriptional repressor LexA [Deltaproteobacteria bacterium]|nr:transcriptional repressor LexA [Deltaproteobacteria bacterium]MBI3388084.1 transcriptional repressor LexA [Deltaproteobacteria bacterium]
MILTKRQKQLFDYIEGYITGHGFAPTLEEIGAQFGLSSLATVHKHLTNLEQKGLITRQANLSRAIEVVSRQKKRRAVELPLLGRVAAGQPIEALETADTIAVPEEFVRKQNTFVLRVAGNSMINDGIFDGDYIVVEERHVPENGETVVAVIDGAATVKRFHREKGGIIRLQPANDTLKPIRVSSAAVTIRGVVVAVMRKY